MSEPSNTNERRIVDFLKSVTLLMLIAGVWMPAARAETAGCPQPRETEYAPAAIASMSNPVPFSQAVLDEAEELYEGDIEPVACISCHGDDGEGDGVMARMFSPAPRNFDCAEVMHQIPDGQLFWIIKNGSIGTSMPAFDKLEDETIWKLVHYLRSFAPPAREFSQVSEADAE